MLTISSPGLEEIARETLVILFDGLNDELDRVGQGWEQRDRQFADLTGSPVREVQLEHVKPENFYDGHHPSFIEAPPDRYPNVSVMAYQWRAAPEQHDQFDTYDDRLYIESFVKAGPGNTDKSDDPAMETEVNRRAQRMAVALNNVVLGNRSLNGIVHPIQQPGSGTVGNVGVARREEKGHGDRYIWQIVRIDYLLRKNSNFPI